VNLPARVMAFVAGLCGVVFGLAGLVRAAALAADENVVWDLPRWWTDLVDGSTEGVVLAAAVAALGAAVYLVMAFRQLSSPGPPATVRVGDVDVKMTALERLVSQRLAAEIPGLSPVRVRVSWAEDGWEVHAVVDARPFDLAGARDRAVGVARAELVRATGRDLGKFALEVRRFVGAGAARGRGSTQRKGLGITRPL
jgi:hypothetical protein